MKPLPRGTVFLLIVFALGADRAKEAKESLQGTWKVVSVLPDRDVRGAEESFAVVKGQTITFAGNKLTWRINESGRREEQEFIIKLNPETAPASFAVVSDDESTELLGQCIYKVDGDELTLCKSVGAVQGKQVIREAERPTKFETSVRNGQMAYRLKRVRNAGTDGPDR